MPGIGLAGASGVGKTTMAKAWSEVSGVPYINPDVRGTLKKLGLDCADISDLDTRIEAQRAVVRACQEAFLDKRTVFVTDRTTIDVAAYTLADVKQHMSSSQTQAIQEIVQDCFDIHNACMHAALTIPIAIPYVEEKGRPPLNAAYQQAIQSLIFGLLKDSQCEVPHYTIQVTDTDPGRRLLAIKQVHGAILGQSCYEAEFCSRLN